MNLELAEKHTAWRAARPHEIPIMERWWNGYNTKQIAYQLHYKRTEPVRRVIAKWKNALESAS